VMDLPRNVELDCVIRYVDSLPNFDVPGYVTLDVRLGWRPTRHVELSLVGQNLLDEGHVEFRTPSTIANTQSGLEVPRGFYAKITCRF
jgi:iron complex outermembrane recepter protein